MTGLYQIAGHSGPHLPKPDKSYFHCGNPPFDATFVVVFFAAIPARR
jgi:hypothetical protein